MRLDALTRDHVELVRQWRNLDLTPYRTPYFITREMQEDFYNNVISKRDSEHRFFSVLANGVFVAMVGFVGISLENRSAEISIVVDPDIRGKGYGTDSLRLLLKHGFDSMNLDNIYGECYECSPAYGWWRKIIDRVDCDYCTMPARKFHEGEYWDSIYFNFTRGNYDNI